MIDMKVKHGSNYIWSSLSYHIKKKVWKIARSFQVTYFQRGDFLLEKSPQSAFLPLANKLKSYIFEGILCNGVIHCAFVVFAVFKDRLSLSSQHLHLNGKFRLQWDLDCLNIESIRFLIDQCMKRSPLVRFPVGSSQKEKQAFPALY